MRKSVTLVSFGMQTAALFFFMFYTQCNRASAQSLLGTSWRASSALTSALSTGVPLDSVVMKFGAGHLWQLIYYPTSVGPADSGTWSQVDMSNFSFSDTSSTSPFITHSLCTAAQIDTDQYVIIADTLRIVNGHGGCGLRETVMIGDWYGHNPTLSTSSPQSRGMITVYPNPVDDVLHVDFGTSQDPARLHITLLDVAGKVVLTEAIIANSGQAVISGLGLLQRGVYFLVVEHDGIRAQEKVIKL